MQTVSLSLPFPLPFSPFRHRYASLWAELLLPRAWHAAFGVLFTGEQPYISVDATTAVQTAAAKAPVAVAVGKAPKSPRAVRAKK
jgi:hypothetical protein